jgi:hypothetical protein
MTSHLGHHSFWYLLSTLKMHHHKKTINKIIDNIFEDTQSGYIHHTKRPFWRRYAVSGLRVRGAESRLLTRSNVDNSGERTHERASERQAHHHYRRGQ